MYNKTRLFFLSLTVVMVLIFGAVGPTPVYADDGTTSGQPTDEAASVTDPVPDEPVPTSEPVVPVEPAATSEPVVPVEPAATVEPVVPVEPAATDEPVIDGTLLEQVPENTTIIVLDSVGEIQPLATQETADAIALSDPIWCPQGKTPKDIGSCTSSFPSFDELLTAMATTTLDGKPLYQVAGTIYVQKDAYLGGESSIDFNNYGLDNINGSDLTIYGGWDPEDNSLTDTSQFNVPIIVGSSASPWGGSLTFNNLQFNNISNNTALTAFSDGDVLISGSEFNNSNIGAEITAGGSVDISDATFNNNYLTGASLTGSKVNIKDSNFNNNGSGSDQNPTGQGLIINSGGKVTLIGVEANDNQLFGANIQAQGNVAIDSSFFSGNQVYTGGKYDGYGLQVVAKKVVDDVTTFYTVTLNDVTASDNYLFGASLTGEEIAIANSFFNSNGSGPNNTAIGQGLIVNSSGSVTLVSTKANDNQLFGAYIQAQGSVPITSSFFTGNKAYTGGTYYGYGLQVVTKEGAVSLNGVDASNNHLYGASLSGEDVSVDNSLFNSNGSGLNEYETQTGAGLIVKGNENVILSTVSLSNVEANNNQLFGADIQATDQVSVENSFFSGNQSYEILWDWVTIQEKAFYGYGLQVVTTGNTTDGPSILLNGVTANENNLWGAWLVSRFPDAGVDVTINNLDVTVTNSQFNNNVTDSTIFIDDTGLLVNSAGNVFLDNVEAKENRLIGAIIEATGNVTITSSILPTGETSLAPNGSSFSHNQGFTCSWSDCNDRTFHGYGLQVLTDGEILLDGVTADENFLWGASLSGSMVTVNNSTFNNNNNNEFGQGPTFHGYGLQVVAPGNIFLNGVTANFNNLWGASLDGLNVEVKNSQFNNNVSPSYIFIDDSGLLVNSAGYVLLDNVEAKYNRLIGADIVATGNVTITNGSSFSHNQGFTCLDIDCNNMVFHGYGLQVKTQGEILLDGVTADENYLFGTYLSGSKVTVKNSFFNNNSYSQGGTFHGYGLQVVATGDILLNGVTASNNGTTGAILNTNGSVTLTNVTAINNGLNGVDIIGSCATTTVEVYNGEYSYNGSYGIKAASATVTLIGPPIFVNNPNLFDGCPGVTPIIITTTTDPVGGNVPLDVPPTDTTTVTNDVVVGNVVALQNTSANTDTENHRRNHSRDNRYSAALQIYKWYRHFRGNLFPYLSFGIGFSGNYYGYYGHRH